MSTEYNCSASPQVIPLSTVEYSHERWVFLTVTYVLIMVTPVICWAVFYWGKKLQRFERLRIRRMVLIYIPMLTLLLHAQVGPGFVMFGIRNFPCWLRSLITLMITPLIASNIVLRLMIFFFLTELSREMTQLPNDDILAEKQGLRSRMIRGTFDIFYALYALVMPNQKAMARSRVVASLTFVASAKGTALIFLIIFLPFLIVAIVLVLHDPVYIDCNGCSFTQLEIFEIIIVGLLYILFGIFASMRVRNYPDPWGLRREVTYMLVCCLVILLGFILATFADPAPDIPFDYQFIIYLGMGGFIFVQTVFQVFLAHTNEYTTKDANVEIKLKRAARKAKKNKVIADSEVKSTSHTAGDRLFLRNVMDNSALCAEFEKFLVAELGVESLMFLKDTAEWRKAYYNIAGSARLARAKRIYNAYIRPTGAFPVNIPSEMNSIIKTSVMAEGLTDCEQEVFDSARDEISDLLQVGALLRFQTSDEYAEYQASHTGGVLATNVL